MTPTFRYNPAVIAQAFATMGCLYPDRIFLGRRHGRGAQRDRDRLRRGAGWPEFKERFARLREAVELMRELWTEERVNFDGEYYSTNDAIDLRPPGRPGPGLHRRRRARPSRSYAGRAGDGFICTSGKGMELYTEKLIPAVEGGRRRRPSATSTSIDRMIEIKLSYDTDPDAALENTRFWAPLSLSARAEARHHRPRRDGTAADALPIEQIA